MDFNALWLIIGFTLTLLVFVGYLIGKNNAIFRLVTYLFVGVASGYLFVLVIEQVLVARLGHSLLEGGPLERALAAIPLIGGLLLLMKISPRLSGLGNVSMAYLVGVGAAVLVGGALFGTLGGQLQAAINPFGQLRVGGAAAGLTLLDGLFTLFGTICTLVYFSFGARARAGQAASRLPVVELLAKVGQVFIGITLGALFAGVFAASIAALIERLNFIWTFIQSLL